jgi:hypothetical protein
MSHNPVPTAPGSSSNFQSIFNTALNNYKKKTKDDLLAHTLTTQLQSCDSPSAILDVLNRQYNIQQFIQSQSDGQVSKQWLNATVTVLCAFSAALGEGVSLVNLHRGFPVKDVAVSPNIQTLGVLTSKSDLCWDRHLPHRAQSPSLLQTNLTRKVCRRLRMLARAKTCSLISSTK